MLRKAFFILLIIILVGCNEEEIRKNVGTLGENDPVTRGEACRMAALSKYSTDDINKMQRIIEFDDTDIDKPYDKYINAAYTAGIIAGVDEQHFAPEQYLTLRQAQFLINKIKGDEKLKLQYDEKDKDKPIPYSVWVAAFERAMNTAALKTTNVNVYATEEECRKLGKSYMLTNLGLTYYDAEDSNTYGNESIAAIVRENTIVAIKAVNEQMAVYDKVEVVDRTDSSITVRLKGGTRRFALENNTFEKGDTVTITFSADGTYEVTSL